MRFSTYAMAGAVVLAPCVVLAQDAGSDTAVPAAPAPDGAAADAAADAPAPPPVKGCIEKLDAGFEETLGEVVGRPDKGQAMYTPAGMTMLERPVSYVLVAHEGSKIDAIHYRLAGLERTIGEAYDGQLLKDFDDVFKGAECARSKESSCGVGYRGRGDYSGAEVGSGELYVASDAEGSKIGMVEADYDLLDTAPVFITCYYRGD